MKRYQTVRCIARHYRHPRKLVLVGMLATVVQAPEYILKPILKHTTVKLKDENGLEFLSHPLFWQVVEHENKIVDVLNSILAFANGQGFVNEDEYKLIQNHIEELKNEKPNRRRTR